jgi:hypothetical protein
MGPAFWWTIGALAAAAGLFAIHRLFLHLEDKGHLYYLKKKPEGGGGAAFLTLQRMIEPQCEHVFVVTDRARMNADADGDPEKPGENTSAGGAQR